MSKTIVISVEEFITRFCNSCRVYKSDGLFYVFRDRPIGDLRQQCQFAIVDKTMDDGSLIWTDCHEGALFTDVTPLVDPGMDRIAVRESAIGRYNQGINSSLRWSA
jgi:hypothetical protein